jgi:hypothetical protein
MVLCAQQLVSVQGQIQWNKLASEGKRQAGPATFQMATDAIH